MNFTFVDGLNYLLEVWRCVEKFREAHNKMLQSYFYFSPNSMGILSGKGPQNQDLKLAHYLLLTFRKFSKHVFLVYLLFET
jgi:hypothetical protein